MTKEEFLEKDNTYCTVPINTNNIFSKAFWRAGNENIKPSDISELRKAYEGGFYVGWDAAAAEYRKTFTHPNAVNLTEDEVSDFMKVLNAFGYCFEYLMEIPYPDGALPNGYHLGLNLCKNPDMPTISDEDKKEIVKLIKNKFEKAKNENI